MGIGESCENACPCIGGFPQLWGVFVLLLTGGTALGASALYALVSAQTSILRFLWPGPWNFFLSAPTFGVVAGLCMLALALLTWCAFRGHGPATAFKVGFAALLAACCALSLVAAAGAIKVLTGFNNQRSPLADAFKGVWLDAKSAAVPSGVEPTTCAVQKRLECVGAWPGDCTGRRGGDTARCDARCKNNGVGKERGCFFPMSEIYTRWNLPLAVTSIIAAICCILAMIVLVLKVSFNLAEQKGNV